MRTLILQLTVDILNKLHSNFPHNTVSLLNASSLQVFKQISDSILIQE
jgi:hypothetical protein